MISPIQQIYRLLPQRKNRMKKYLIIGAVLSLVFSCSVDHKDPDLTDFGGEIVNPTGDFVILTKIRSPRERALNAPLEADTLKIDSLRWAGTQKKFKKGKYLLEYGEFQKTIYLEPGKSLFYKLDTKDTSKQLAYKGKLKKVARYLQEIGDKSDSIRQQTRAYYTLSEKDFIHKIDSSRKELDKLTTLFVTNNIRFEEQFFKQEYMNNLYSMAAIAYRFPQYAPYYQEGVTVSDTFRSFFSTLTLSDESALQNQGYLDYLDAVLDVEGEKRMVALLDKGVHDGDAFFLGKIQAIDSLFHNQPIVDWLSFKLLSDFVQFQMPNLNDSVATLLTQRCQDSEFLSAVEKEKAKWNHLLKSQPAPAFTYPDIDGKPVSLSSLRGNYVYVDVWATWCGPCKTEVPYLKKLERDFSDKPVKFVSISVDENKSAWQNMVQDQNLSGIQLFANGWSQITKDYLINGIPRFILIDPNGKLINANAARPSGNIREELNLLLND